MALPLPLADTPQPVDPNDIANADGNTGLTREVATLAGIRSVLTSAYSITVIRDALYIQGYAAHGANHIALRLGLERNPAKDHAGFRYHRGRIGSVDIQLVVDTTDPTDPNQAV